MGALNAEIVRAVRKLADRDPSVSVALGALRNSKRPRIDDLEANAALGVLVAALRCRFDAFCRERGAQRPAHVPAMSGSDFEDHGLLRALPGVEHARLVGGAADRGGDILFRIGQKRLVVQVKRYAKPVGSAAVREAHAARDNYECDAAWVISNEAFTREAIRFAQRLRVRLVTLITESSLEDALRSEQEVG